MGGVSVRNEGGRMFDRHEEDEKEKNGVVGQKKMTETKDTKAPPVVI